MFLAALPYITLIITAIVSAWALLSSAAAVSAFGYFVAAIRMLPATRLGDAPAEWLTVANYYIPVGEALVMFTTYLTISALIRLGLWMLRLAAAGKKG